MDGREANQENLAQKKRTKEENRKLMKVACMTDGAGNLRESSTTSRVSKRKQTQLTENSSACIIDRTASFMSFGPFSSYQNLCSISYVLG